jgi:hypothetical protein
MRVNLSLTAISNYLLANSTDYTAEKNTVKHFCLTVVFVISAVIFFRKRTVNPRYAVTMPFPYGGFSIWIHHMQFMVTDFPGRKIRTQGGRHPLPLQPL